MPTYLIPMRDHNDREIIVPYHVGKNGKRPKPKPLKETRWQKIVSLLLYITLKGGARHKACQEHQLRQLREATK